MSAEQALASRHPTHLPLEVWQNGVPANPWQSLLAWQAATQLPATQNGASGDLQSEAVAHAPRSGGLGKPQAARATVYGASQPRCDAGVAGRMSRLRSVAYLPALVIQEAHAGALSGPQ